VAEEAPQTLSAEGGQPAALHEGTAPAAGEAHEGGLPQLRYEYWPGQIVWMLIVFVAVYVVLSKVFLPKVSAAMAARDERIAGDMEAARALRDQAQAEAEAAEAEIGQARARAQKTAADAKARAAAEAAERQGALEADLNAKLAEAETRIRASRDAAMSQVRGVAAETAAAIAEKLTGKAADAAEVETALASVSGQA